MMPLSHNSVALIIGGYVNGYSIIKGLHESEVPNIWLFDYGNSLARRSRLLMGVSKIDKDPASLLKALSALHEKYERIVIYPTDDLQLEALEKIGDQVEDYCFLPFNRASLLSCLNKQVQYKYCDQLGVPYPRTQYLRTASDIELALGMKFPLLIKPSRRDDLHTKVFRNLFVNTPEELEDRKVALLGFMESGLEFLASECVPGDDTNIYAYTAYRSKDGKILSEWIGKKLTQFPDKFGVFSSASNYAPDIVREQGRCLIEGMDLTGIVEPEFKFDPRDGSYKLMEINLRSMMWHRTGSLSGVNLQYSQWLDATGQPPRPQRQTMVPRVHFVYMKHELINLLSRRGYLRHFLYNVFGGDLRDFAVFNVRDMRPFFHDVITLPRGVAGIWLRLLRKRFSRR
jgi:predicted ATP-grasp superfamily ATP-dependent carboligase